MSAIPPPGPGGQRSVNRILDVEGNRAAEGLRVLEEVARFLLDDAQLVADLRRVRHGLRMAVPSQAVGDRDTVGDVGDLHRSGEASRSGLVALVRANAARVQEALRTGEEISRIAGQGRAGIWEKARYEVYGLELRLLSRLPAWRLWQVRLYCLVDASLCDDPVAVAGAAARGGAGIIQVRAKRLTIRDYRELASRVFEAAKRHGAFTVVNDHAALVPALAADGIHLGQEDLDPADARLVVGPLAAIGVSCHEPGQVEIAQSSGADYVGLGPIHATATKSHEPERGAGLLDAVRGLVTVPSFAIGGIDVDRLRPLVPRLPHGVAVAGAICRAADPERAAAELRDLLERDDPGLTADRRRSAAG